MRGHCQFPQRPKWTRRSSQGRFRLEKNELFLPVVVSSTPSRLHLCTTTRYRATLPRRECPGYSVHKTRANNLRTAVPAKGRPRRLSLSRRPPAAASRTTPPRTPGRHPPRERTTKRQQQQTPSFCRLRLRLLTVVQSPPSRTPPRPIAPAFRLALSQQSGRSVGAATGHVRVSQLQASVSRRACAAGRR